MPTPEQQRIMLFMHALHGGGSERQMSYLANELAKTYPTTLVTLAYPQTNDYPIDSRVQRIGLGLTSQHGGWIRGLFANRRRIVALRRVCQRIDPAVCISFCDTNNVLAGMAWGKTKPLIVCERSDPRRQKLNRAWEFLRDRAYPRAAGIVSQTNGVTNYFRARFAHRLSGVRLETIPSAIVPPESLVKPAIGLKDSYWDNAIEQRRVSERKRLLVVGRLSPEKRIDRAIDAWGQIARRHPEWVLRIVGDGSMRDELMELAKNREVDSRTEFALWSNDVWSEYQAAHAYCLPSDYEGFPQSLIEAMHCKLPTVVWECGEAVQELMGRDGTCGVVVHDTDSLANAFELIFNDASLRERMGRESGAVASRYQWSAIAPRWLELIRDVGRLCSPA
ncbi:MAG: glycosyltransferase family 4 protein [Planctomycetes bacterium]|nr:glycosyltransferase family 4 protein [Planctomycetota bacterium]